jgi:hypothetical protein
MPEVLDFSTQEVVFPQDLDAVVRDMVVNRTESIVVKPTILEGKDYSVQLTQELIQDKKKENIQHWRFRGSLLQDSTQTQLPGIHSVLRFTFETPLSSVHEISATDYIENQTRDQAIQLKGASTLFSPFDDAIMKAVVETTGKPVRRTVITSNPHFIEMYKHKGFTEVDLGNPNIQEKILEKVFTPTDGQTA